MKRQQSRTFLFALVAVVVAMGTVCLTVLSLPSANAAMSSRHLTSRAGSSTTAKAPAASSGNVSGVSLVLSSDAPGASGVSYTVKFTTSSTGGLVAGSSTITVSAASGTVLPTCADVTDLTTASGTFSGCSGGSPGASQTITTPADLAAGDTVQVVFSGATNTSTAGTHTLSVSTSSDGAGTTSYSIAASSGNVCGSSRPTVRHVYPIGNSRQEIVRVLITGSCLGGASHVMFGSVAATSFTVHYPGNIVASPPQQPAGTVDVTVTTPGGTSPINKPGDQYTYYVPTITLVAPNHGPVTGGSTVLIRGSMFSGTPAPTVSFGTGNFSSSVVVASDTTIHALVPPHTSGTVDVRVTAFSGSSLPTPADHYTYK